MLRFLVKSPLRGRLISTARHKSSPVAFFNSKTCVRCVATGQPVLKKEEVEVTFHLANGKKIKAKGKEGDSLLDIVVNNNVPLDGFGACEGTLTCSTCHLIFEKKDFDKLPDKPTDEELDMLDLAYELTDTSRLGCQIIMTKELNGIEIKVPAGVNDGNNLYWVVKIGYGVKMKWISILTFICFIPSGYSYFSDWYNSILDKLNYEICDDNYITPDFYKLRKNLNSMLFGQNLVIERVVPILETHFKLEPKKALVICMHGWTGSGKNYATKIIIDSLFKKKSDSEFVRMFNGRLHFPVEKKEYIDEYKINIQNWIKGNVTKCPRSVFVFDEIDKMPAGIIDAVKPFFDYHEKIDSVDYRKCIFIFISNIGAEIINAQYMELWRHGKSRIDMQYKDFEPYLRKALYNTKGGFKESAILEGHLVSLYLPFLPLEVADIEKCIEAELIRQKLVPVKENYITAVLDEMEFNSDGISTSGCKRVADIVAAIKYKKQYEEL